jgi:hypothetical protein
MSDYAQAQAEISLASRHWRQALSIVKLWGSNGSF